MLLLLGLIFCGLQMKVGVGGAYIDAIQAYLEHAGVDRVIIYIPLGSNVLSAAEGRPHALQAFPFSCTGAL